MKLPRLLFWLKASTSVTGCFREILQTQCRTAIRPLLALFDGDDRIDMPDPLLPIWNFMALSFRFP